MYNISGTGSVALLVADKTFPQGVEISDFTTDEDPLQVSERSVGDLSVGLNGTATGWRKIEPISLTLSVQPNTPSDENLNILAKLNSVGSQRTAIQDAITLTFIYPDGRSVQLIDGVITTDPMMSGIASEGKIKAKRYSFKFGDVRYVS